MLIDWIIPYIARHVNFGGAAKYRATARVRLNVQIIINNKAIPSHIYTIGLSLVFGCIIEGNFQTNHSIKSIYYLEVQMLVVHKINYMIII